MIERQRDRERAWWYLCDYFGLCPMLHVFEMQEERVIIYSLEKWLSLPKKKELARTQVCQQKSSEKKGESYENQKARSHGWWKVFQKSMWTAEFATAQKLQRTLKPRKERTIHLKNRMGWRETWSKVFIISVFPVLFISDLMTSSFLHLRSLPAWVLILKSNYFHL